MNLIYRLICFWKGHRRGKFIGQSDKGLRRFQCPRCKRITERK